MKSPATKNNITLHSFLFAVAWGIYMFYIMPLADQVTGPCEGTPGHDYKLAIVVLPLYFAFFGYWIFQFLAGPKSTLMKIILTVFLLVILPLISMLALFSFLLNDTVATFIRSHNWFDIFYKYGCYGDIDVQDLCLTVITSLCVWLAVFCIRYFR